MATVGEWMTVEEAANWIGLPREVIDMAARNREIPALTIGGMVRIHRDALLSLVGGSLPPGSTPPPLPAAGPATPPAASPSIPPVVAPAAAPPNQPAAPSPVVQSQPAPPPTPLVTEVVDDFAPLNAPEPPSAGNQRNGAGFVSRFGGRFR